ncbi:MAG: helix-turn-helix domain-containing protein [Caenispirillum bisanense]|nr:helix-turn-helix domain-containing protein [Caenispirillum bisanense]
MTPRQVAEALGLSDRTVRRMIAEGALPALKLPRGGYRIYRETLVELMQRWAAPATTASDTASSGTPTADTTSPGPRVVQLDGFQRAQQAMKRPSGS